MRSQQRPDDASSEPRSGNLRTALILLSIATVFFGGIIASQLTGGEAVWIGAVGFAIIGYLLVMVGTRARARSDARKRRPE